MGFLEGDYDADAELARSAPNKLKVANRIIKEAIEAYEPARVLALLSGGNDSTTMLRAVRRWVAQPPNGVLHINTGIGIPQTRRFVRSTCKHWNLPLHEVTPPPILSPRDQARTAKSEEAIAFMKDLHRRLQKAEIDWYSLTPYEQLVVRFGFPGPAGHRLAYIRLKERSLEKFLAETRSKRGEKVLLLSGVRLTESTRRMAMHNLVEKKGGQIWLNPFFFFSKEDLAAYRARFDVPHNEVSDHLHMSGECLCGAFAKPGELEEIRFFYPEVADYIEQIQELAKSVGNPRCQWGPAPGESAADQGWTGPMCHSCDVLNQARKEAAGT